MKTFGRTIPFIIYLFLLILPSYVWFTSRSYDILKSGVLGLRESPLLIFPLLGLLAFTTLWVQIMIGSFMPFWNKLYAPPRVLRFHIVHGIVSWCVILSHPALLYISRLLTKGFVLDVFKIDYVASQNVPNVILGILGFILVTIVLLAGLFRRKAFLIKHWKKLHYLNYVAFILVLLHSLRLGTHVATTNLQYLWYIYAGLFVIALVYKRFYRPVRKALEGPKTANIYPQKPV